ncbi:hypothetical protein TEA_007015 [Camellia sinensis var. sinensis]|uniref:Uncharacterized protein n=1 Tax=Camellia sinensis var. sinensis TaxID=542762 RepID=A0A4S4DSS6_CAMSN|nr:hypothetical protein TEA_007015 [Camellia sinensis var. sinensis]
MGLWPGPGLPLAELRQVQAEIKPSTIKTIDSYDLSSITTTVLRQTLLFYTENSTLIHHSYKEKEMVLWSSYPPTPNQLAATVACFVAGATLFAVGVHLSFTNVATQQARTKARNDFIKARLRKLLQD